MVKPRLLKALVVVFFISTLAAVSVFGQSDSSDTNSTEPAQPSEAVPPSSSETNAPSSSAIGAAETGSASAPASSAAPQRCPAGESGCTVDTAPAKILNRAVEGAKAVILNSNGEGRVEEVKKTLKDCGECGTDAIKSGMDSITTGATTGSRAPNSIAQPPPLSSYGELGEAVTEEKQVEQREEQARQEQQQQQQMEEEARRRADAARTPEPHYYYTPEPQYYYVPSYGPNR